MEGLRLTMRAVCLSVVAVGLAVPGAVGQTPLATPAAPTVSNNSTTGGLDVKLQRVYGASQYAITLINEKAQSKQTLKVTPPDPAAQTWVTSTAALQSLTQFSVTVHAENSTSTSAESPAASIITPPAPPTNITGVGGLQKVTVSWTAAPGAASYQLNMSNQMSFTTTATTYVVTGLQTATNYNVTVASINSSGGRGMFSAPVTVRTANVALQ